MDFRKEVLFGVYQENEDNFTKLSNKVEIVNLQKKSAAYSQKVRKQGNDLFLQNKVDSKTNQQIFLKYTESIAYAPSGSETLALAYGNRSAFLLRIKKLKESIEDIDRALGITKSNTLKIKLLCRKVECLKKQGSTSYEKVLKEAQDAVDNCNEIEKREFQSKFLNKAKGRFDLCDEPSMKIMNKDLTNDSLFLKNDKKKVNNFDSIYLGYNDEYGRLLKAKKDIKAGEIIYVEKAYVTVPNWLKHLACCNHCLKMTWSNIPCDSCTWAIYCSEECKKIAWKEYHDIECTIICNNEDFGIKESNAGIRMFIMGIKEAGNSNSLKTMIEKGEYMSKDTSIEKFVDLTFEKFYFSSNIIDRDISQYKSNELGFSKIQSIACTVLTTVIFLTRYSPVFADSMALKDLGDFESFKKNDMAVFICLHFMKVVEMSSSYGHKLGSDQVEVELNEGIGHSVPRISSFINNSCYLNIRQCFGGGQKIITYAVRPIKKNEQLFSSYKKPFFMLKKEERIKLNPTFVCKCIACRENWPPVLSDGAMGDIGKMMKSTKNVKKGEKVFKAARKIALEVYTSLSSDVLGPLLDKISNMFPEILKYFPQPSMLPCQTMMLLVLIMAKLYEYNDIFDENMSAGSVQNRIAKKEE